MISRLNKLLLMVIFFSLSFSSYSIANQQPQHDKKNISAIDKAGSATKNFNQLMEKFTTLSGSFKQTLNDKEGEELQKTTGIFKLKRPGNFYWETLPPYEQKVIGNETTLWLYDPDLEQVSIKSQTNSSTTPAMILSGDIKKINTHYVVNQAKDGKNIFVLHPKNIEENDFMSIVLKFKKNLLASLSIEDKLNQVTRIEFSKVKLNETIENANFNFVPPEGVDVIRE